MGFEFSHSDLGEALRKIVASELSDCVSAGL